MPGLKEEGFNVRVNDGLFNCINDDWQRRGFRHQSFTRSFSLQDTLNGDNIKTRYGNGAKQQQYRDRAWPDRKKNL